MKLFTKEINNKLFKQYQEGNDLDNQMVVAKIFNPYGRGRWFLVNSDPQDPDYLWAIVQMGDVVEVGSVLRSELESIRVSPFKFPLERDLGFSEVNAGELLRGLQQGKFYKEGGSVEYGTGGMTAGRWYKDNSGEEYRLIGENNEGRLLFSDGESVVVKDESDFISAPKEKKLFGLFEEGGELKEEFLEDVRELHGEIKEIILVDGTKISHEELMAAHKMSNDEDKMEDGGQVVNNKLNLEVKKMAVEKGLTPKELGRDYELVMAQAVVAALTDANYHDEARKLVSILEKNPKIAEKPNYPSPSDPKFKEKMAEIEKVYGSEYFEADEKTSAFARKVSGKAEYDGYDVANAFEYVLKMNGFSPLAAKINKSMEEDNTMADGGEVESEAKRLSDNPNWTNEKLTKEYNDNKRDLNNFNNGLLKPSKVIGTGYKSSAVAKRLAKEWLENNIATYKKALEIRGVMADGGEVGGRGWGNYKKGKRITDISKLKVGESYLSYNKQFNSKNIIKITSGDKTPLKRDIVYGGFVRDKNDKKVEGDFAIWSNELKELELYEIRDVMAKGGGIYSSDSMYILKVLKKGQKQVGEEKFRAKNLIEAKEIVEDDYEDRYKSEFGDELTFLVSEAMAKGGRVKFSEKVKAIKASLLKTKKVSPKVQKDYGKTYSAKEAEEAAKRIAGSMRKKGMK